MIFAILPKFSGSFSRIQRSFGAVKPAKAMLAVRKSSESKSESPAIFQLPNAPSDSDASDARAAVAAVVSHAAASRFVRIWLVSSNRLIV